ncbi:spermidine synthase [Trichonephila clavipes]|nr:spermidine synthase [Trichonephila clavipes]
MDAFKEGWYTETGSLYSAQALSMKVEKILCHKKSKYQDVLIFESTIFGKVLVLDDCVQVTEFDECSYQEMISFLPLNSHPNPKKVLVIGGGDGGVVREAVKHPSVESVTLCELDEEVIEVSKKFLPFMAKGFDSPKLTLFIGDGAEFVKNHPNEFDVIITDSPDPKGPAVCLFQKPYYESLKQALKPGGLIASQGEQFWYDRRLVKEMIKMCKTLFPVVDYGASYVPSFPAGQMGYLCCSTSPDTNFREPLNKFSCETLKKLELKYYTPDVHRAAFALPLMIAECSIPARKPVLLTVIKNRRLQFAKDYTVEGWEKVTWFDESRFSPCVLTYHTNGWERIMKKQKESMWFPALFLKLFKVVGQYYGLGDVILGHFMGPLIHDEEYLNAEGCLSVIADQVHPVILMVYPDRDGYFQQDNAPCYILVCKI